MLQETLHTTVPGEHVFLTIPPEQVAERYLYIELDVEHPDDATRAGFGYALGMTRKNEKLNERPFFETNRAAPGRADHRSGRDARWQSRRLGSRLLAYSRTDKLTGSAHFEYGSFARATTTPRASFGCRSRHPAKAVYWVLPKAFAPEHASCLPDGNRGDLGTITLI